MIKLIASDIDGTLLKDGAQTLDPELFDVISKLKEKGIRFVASSGRGYNSLFHLFEPVADDIYYISENGAILTYEDQKLSSGEIPRELALRIFKAAREWPCAPFVSCVDRSYTDSDNEEFLHIMRDVIHYDIEKVDSMDNIRKPFIKFALCDFGADIDTFGHFRELFGQEITIVTSGKDWVDFVPDGVNKGIALEKLCNLMGISREECIAFGDEYNDTAMLEFAGIGYAMEPCAPGVEKYANKRTDSVLKVLKELLASL